jgi:hypothetical protein
VVVVVVEEIFQLAETMLVKMDLLEEVVAPLHQAEGELVLRDKVQMVLLEILDHHFKVVVEAVQVFLELFLEVETEYNLLLLELQLIMEVVVEAVQMILEDLVV